MNLQRYDLLTSFIAKSPTREKLKSIFFYQLALPPLLVPLCNTKMYYILSIILLISFAITASAYALSDRPVLKYGTAWKKEVCTVLYNMSVDVI